MRLDIDFCKLDMLVADETVQQPCWVHLKLHVDSSFHVTGFEAELGGDDADACSGEPDRPIGGL
jgi:hypothetical protein